MATLRVHTYRQSGAPGATRHWLDVAGLPAGRTVVTAGAIAVTVPHSGDLVGWLTEECRTTALRDRPPPAALNELGAVASGSAAHTVAAAYLRHDPDLESVRFANAGYGTVLIVAPDGRTDVVAVNNSRPLIGVPRRRTAMSAAFPIGSSLVLHAHTPGCSSRGPSADDLLAEVNEARLATRGATSQAAVCAVLARALRCDNERDESVVVLLTATGEGEGGDEPFSVFAGRPESAAAARSFALRAMDEWRLVGAANRAAAIVGELAANAIQHAGTPFSVRLTRRATAVTVEVADESPELPQVVPAGPYDSGHRGLLIVETLAQRWGVHPTERGKAVWAELLV